MFKRGLGIGLTIVAALIVVAGLLMGLARAAPVTDVAAAPEQTMYWCGSNTYCNIALQSGDGITASQISENYVRQGGSIVFDVAELMCTMDEGSVQTQTVKLQYSADGTNWVDHGSGACAEQTADGTVAVRITALYGVYWRAYVTLGGSNLTTPTVQLVLKRTQ